MTANATRRAVVFDLDGTLVDSAPDIANALNIALAKSGLAAVTVDQTRGILGGGARVLVGNAVALAGGEPSQVDSVIEDYSAAYATDPISRTEIYADAEPTLRTLRDREVHIGVCTNKRFALAERVLAGVGLSDLVDALVGIDSVPASKPDPAHLRATLRQLQVSAENTIYVGDTAIDAETAERAGVGYRHVAWGQPVAGVTSIESFAELLKPAVLIVS